MTGSDSLVSPQSLGLRIWVLSMEYLREQHGLSSLQFIAWQFKTLVQSTILDILDLTPDQAKQLTAWLTSASKTHQARIGRRASLKEGRYRQTK